MIINTFALNHVKFNIGKPMKTQTDRKKKKMEMMRRKDVYNTSLKQRTVMHRSNVYKIKDLTESMTFNGSHECNSETNDVIQGNLTDAGCNNGVMSVRKLFNKNGLIGEILRYYVYAESPSGITKGDCSHIRL